MSIDESTKTPVAVLSSADGTYTETLYLGSEGTLEFADGAPAGTTLGAGGIDPQDLTKLVGEKTGIIEATYGDFEASEFEDELRGRDGLQVFMKMLSDSSIEQGLSRRRDTLVNTEWRMVPPSTDPEGLEQAAFCADQLGMNDMKAGKYSFQQLLYLFHMSEVLRRSAGELVFAQGPDGKMVLDKILPMHPLTIDKYEYDTKGGLKNLVQKGKIRGEGGKTVEKKIPIFKTVVFTNRDDGIGEGESVLRAAIVHWRIKRALLVLMNQGLERFALGVPMIKPPSEVVVGSAQWKAARKMAIDYVTRPRTGVILPAGWEFEVITLNNSMPDIIPYIEYHDRCIMRALGVESTSVGLKEGQSVPGSDKALTDSLRAMLSRFASAINLYVIPKLILLNWPDATVFPRIVPELDSGEDIAAAANLYGMFMNAAIDMVVSQEQAEIQREAAQNTAENKPAGAAGKAGAVAGGASRSGSGKTPSAKFADVTEDSPDSSGSAGKVAELITALMDAAPTKIQRIIGYLEDKQSMALDPHRQSAQTVRTADRRKSGK